MIDIYTWLSFWLVKGSFRTSWGADLVFRFKKKKYNIRNFSLHFWCFRFPLIRLPKDCTSAMLSGPKLPKSELCKTWFDSPSTIWEILRREYIATQPVDVPSPLVAFSLSYISILDLKLGSCHWTTCLTMGFQQTPELKITLLDSLGTSVLKGLVTTDPIVHGLLIYLPWSFKSSLWCS